jgi:hypothetical protein
MTDARLARGNDSPRAISACILNKVPQEDVKVIQETFNHHVKPMAWAWRVPLDGHASIAAEGVLL